MGCGKSTVGPRLAALLEWAFFDLDDKIVSAVQMPISRYFTEAGEPAFRDVERQQLLLSENTHNQVIAVGGGALCSQENLDWAKRHGVVVYLQVSVDALISRLKSGHATRPMLLGKSGQLLSDDAVRSRISGLLEQRTSFYEQADLTIHTDDLTVEEVAGRVCELVSQ
ncbi:MAG: shikimate kinase [Rhodothermales bacterium]